MHEAFGDCAPAMLVGVGILQLAGIAVRSAAGGAGRVDSSRANGVRVAARCDSEGHALAHRVVEDGVSRIEPKALAPRRSTAGQAIREATPDVAAGMGRSLEQQFAGIP